MITVLDYLVGFTEFVSLKNKNVISVLHIKKSEKV
jgi:hypothetical protein